MDGVDSVVCRATCFFRFVVLRRLSTFRCNRGKTRENVQRRKSRCSIPLRLHPLSVDAHPKC